MAANKLFRAGPLFLTTTTTTNILNPGTTTGGVNSTAAPYVNLVIILRHIRVTNNSAAAAKFALWLTTTGANTAGKELIWGGAASGGALTQGVSVAANSFVEWFGLLRLDASNTSDFIVGGTDTASALAIELEGEIGVA